MREELEFYVQAIREGTDPRECLQDLFEGMGAALGLAGATGGAIGGGARGGLYGAGIGAAYGLTKGHFAAAKEIRDKEAQSGQALTREQKKEIHSRHRSANFKQATLKGLKTGAGAGALAGAALGGSVGMAIGHGIDHAQKQRFERDADLGARVRSTLNRLHRN
jgi:hypothetical protein